MPRSSANFQVITSQSSFTLIFLLTAVILVVPAAFAQIIVNNPIRPLEHL